MTPQIGMPIWLYALGQDPNDRPCAAIITFVWSDETVNVAAFNAQGDAFPEQQVNIFTGDGDFPPTPFCKWTSDSDDMKGFKERIHSIEMAVAAISKKLGIQ